MDGFDKIELERLRGEVAALTVLSDKLSAERDAAVAARVTLRRDMVELLADVHAGRLKAEKENEILRPLARERDDLRTAVVVHRRLTNRPTDADLELWHAARLESPGPEKFVERSLDLG